MAITCFFVVSLYGISSIRRGVGIPLLAAVATVFVWYVGDVLYNNYRAIHLSQFSPGTIDQAWWQVSAFLIALLVFVFLLNRRLSGNLPQTYFLYRNGVKFVALQQMLHVFFRLCVAIWLILLVFAFLNVGFKAVFFALPVLGSKVAPFARPQIGGGISAILSLAQNFYLLVGAGFGVIAALATNQRLRWLAILACLLIWPNFFLDRTRNTMLAVALPGVLAYVFFRIRASNSIRISLLALAFTFLSAWFSFVMQSRGYGVAVSRVFLEEGIESVLQAEASHAGLNMFEELCWMNRFIAQGQYLPNWGARYFAELVNPVPRALWPSKPTIGLDYAVARGQVVRGSDGAVTATISTGVIGQGVNNFGIYFGPLAAAFLMSLWVSILARLDTSPSAYRLPLLLVGLVLTFNLGRDITFITLYPFVFGYVAIRVIEEMRKRRRPRLAVPARP
ncbi:MAG: hypothetical protein AAGI44_09330 [Pseudomonadota bacterium]